MTLKAEDSLRLNNNSHLNERRFEPQNARDLDTIKWTGSGFMKVYDGGILKFNLIHGYNTGLYDIIMRYEPNDYEWQDVSVKIKNLRSASSNSGCSVLAQDQREVEHIAIRIQNSI